MATMTLVRPQIGIDYPQQDEVISSPQYSIRISAPKNATAVELAIDQDVWQPCRESVGFWWFDWAGYEPGEHELIARYKGPDGKWRRAVEPREFFVAKV